MVEEAAVLVSHSVGGGCTSAMPDAWLMWRPFWWPVSAALSLVIAYVVSASDHQDTDALHSLDSVSSAVNKRFEHLTSPMHFWVLLSGMTAVGVAWCTTSVEPERVSSMWIVEALTILGSFGLIYFITRSLQTPRRNRGVRALFVTGTICFRLLRIADLLFASDRPHFIRAAAAQLSHSSYELATTWCCFLQGLVVGHLQPPASLGWRVAFVLSTMGSSAVPALVGYALVGVPDWLLVNLRLTLVPSTVGLAVEIYQRHFFKRAFANAICSEQAKPEPERPPSPSTLTLTHP